MLQSRKSVGNKYCGHTWVHYNVDRGPRTVCFDTQFFVPNNTMLNMICLLHFIKILHIITDVYGIKSSGTQTTIILVIWGLMD